MFEPRLEEISGRNDVFLHPVSRADTRVSGNKYSEKYGTPGFFRSWVEDAFKADNDLIAYRIYDGREVISAYAGSGDVFIYSGEHIGLDFPFHGDEVIRGGKAGLNFGIKYGKDELSDRTIIHFGVNLTDSYITVARFSDVNELRLAPNGAYPSLSPMGRDLPARGTAEQFLESMDMDFGDKLRRFNMMSRHDIWRMGSGVLDIVYALEQQWIAMTLAAASISRTQLKPGYAQTLLTRFANNDAGIESQAVRLTSLTNPQLALELLCKAGKIIKQAFKGTSLVFHGDPGSYNTGVSQVIYAR